MSFPLTSIPGLYVTSTGGGAGPAAAPVTVQAPGFTQPFVGSMVNVPVSSSASYVAKAFLLVAGGGLYLLVAIPDATHVVLLNLGTAINAPPGAVIGAGALVDADDSPRSQTIGVPDGVGGTLLLHLDDVRFDSLMTQPTVEQAATSTLVGQPHITSSQANFLNANFQPNPIYELLPDQGVTVGAPTYWAVVQGDVTNVLGAIGQNPNDPPDLTALFLFAANFPQLPTGVDCALQAGSGGTININSVSAFHLGTIGAGTTLWTAAAAGWQFFGGLSTPLGTVGVVGVTDAFIPPNGAAAPGTGGGFWSQTAPLASGGGVGFWIEKAPGATISQLSQGDVSKQAVNGAPVAVTNAATTLATANITTMVPAQRVAILASVSADNVSAGLTSATSLLYEVTVDAVVQATLTKKDFIGVSEQDTNTCLVGLVAIAAAGAHAIVVRCTAGANGIAQVATNGATLYVTNP